MTTSIAIALLIPISYIIGRGVGYKKGHSACFNKLEKYLESEDK